MLDQNQLNAASRKYLQQDGFKDGEYLTERDIMDIFEAGARWAETALNTPALPPEVEQVFGTP